MSTYALQRAEIKSQLQAVSGIGLVYDSAKNPTTEELWNSLYIAPSTKIVNVVFFNRLNMAGKPVKDEAIQITETYEKDNWQITLLYGFHDDPANPSEYAFNNLVDAIQNQFRFLQDLNGQAYSSDPLVRITSGLFQFLGGKVLCHKAVWHFTATNEIVDQLAETN